jgi:predicted GIY-YIG superfamily endonuclease
MSKQSFNYYVYMLSNDEETLYTGVTGDLFRRTSGSIEQGQARNLPHDIVR